VGGRARPRPLGEGGRDAEGEGAGLAPQGTGRRPVEPRRLGVRRLGARVLRRVVRLEVGVVGRPERDASRPSGRGGAGDPDVPQGRPYVAVPPKPTPGPGEEGFQLPEDYRVFAESRIPRAEDRPRVILAFPKAADVILLSGMLEGGEEIAGKGVVVDAPLGKGHVLLFACNPMWRVNTQGTYALVTNAVLNWNALSLGWPPKK